MAYFAPYIDGEGIHIPTYADIMEHLIEEYKRIFGQEIYLGEDTQDYQMLSVFAKSMDDLNALVTQNYNARNPNYATGDALDLLLQLNAISRKKATSSTVTLTLGGDAGTVIPIGSQAIDKDGYIWELQEECTLDANGEGTAKAACTEPGTISADAGAINNVYTPVTGWYTVTNAAVATVGTNTETDAEVRARRNKSVSMNTNGTIDALLRALNALDNVKYVALQENNTNETNELGIPGHSICAIVSGGESYEIATEIWKNKAPGVGTYGNTSVNYIDDSQNTNIINFTRPTNVLVTVTVSLTAGTGYDATRIDPIIKDAIINEIGALGAGKSWGVTMAYKDIYNCFDDDVPFVITGISGTNTHGTSTTLVQCNYNEVLYTDAEHITITVS